MEGTRYVESVSSFLPNGALTSVTSVSISSEEEEIPIPYSYGKAWIVLLPLAAVAVFIGTIVAFARV